MSLEHRSCKNHEIIAGGTSKSAVKPVIYLKLGNSPGTKSDISLRPAPFSFKRIPVLLRSPNVTNDVGLGIHKSFL